MKYDFTSILDRGGHDALAVDLPLNYVDDFRVVQREEGFDVIPMWVADMNFAICPSILEAIKDRLSYPTFGYYKPSDAYYESIIKWHKNRNGIDYISKENIGYENGVLGGLVAALNTLLPSGGKVLLHSPTYIGFTMSIENAGYEIIHSPLIKEDNTWRMDYEDMEKKIVEHNINVAIMCNPHNPCGRVFTRDELSKAIEIFEKHNVYIISDEIWSDIILYSNKHVPTHSINDYAKNHTISLYAPSKTFNLAGLIGAYHIIFNKDLNKKITETSSKCHYNSMNVLSMHALIGAYTSEGEQWVKELHSVIESNVDYACNFIRNNLKGVTLATPEATYMLFVDSEEYCLENNITLEELLHRCWKYGVYVQNGKPFHGEYSLRINLALPTSKVIEAFNRLQQYVFI